MYKKTMSQTDAAMGLYPARHGGMQIRRLNKYKTSSWQVKIFQVCVIFKRFPSNCKLYCIEYIISTCTKWTIMLHHFACENNLIVVFFVKYFLVPYKGLCS